MRVLRAVRQGAERSADIIDQTVSSQRGRGRGADQGPASVGEIVKEAVRALAKLPKEDQVLRVWNREVTLTRTDVESARRRAKRSGRAHNVARESFARELMDVLALRLAREAGDADSEGRRRSRGQALVAHRDP